MKTVSERKEFEEVGGYSPRPEPRNDEETQSDTSSASSSGLPSGKIEELGAIAKIQEKIVESSFSPRSAATRE